MAKGDITTRRHKDVIDKITESKGGHKTVIDNGWNKPSSVGYGRTREESRNDAFKKKNKKKSWWD